jgi:hypothetical protein
MNTNHIKPIPKSVGNRITGTTLNFADVMFHSRPFARYNKFN